MVDNKFYSNKIVNKPWGYEYVIYADRNKISITYVHINYNQSTSLHCHPKKKTGFIILKGPALVQIGIYKKNKKKFNSLSRLVFRPGLFHSLKAISKKGLTALEFEVPYIKKDLIRFKDRYGRQDKKYEGKEHTNKINSNLKKFLKPIKNLKNKYLIDNVEIIIEKKKNFTNFSNKDNNSSSSILDGAILDKNKQKVISAGEIVKTRTLKILSKRFGVSKPILVLTARKNKK